MSTDEKKDSAHTALRVTELPDAPTFEFGEITLDLLNRQVSISGKQYALSPKEFPLLYLLVRRNGKFVDRAELCSAIKSPNNNTALENQLYRLRKKLRGCGYRIAYQCDCGYRLERGDD